MALADSFEGFIFDYGGVLVHHQSGADQARMADLAGMPVEQFTERYWADRLDYDKGLVTNVEYWQNLAGRSAEVSPEIVQQLTEIDSESWMNYDAVMWNWVNQLRAAGKRIGMLSNMPRDLGEALRTRTSKLDGFDQVTLSYELHSVKPDPAIYEHCLEGLGTAPEQTLFLDDRIANVQGAELLGIRALQFTSRDEVLLRLRD
jgi:putative hydrolase of the HAD superfamily